MLMEVGRPRAQGRARRPRARHPVRRRATGPGRDAAAASSRRPAYPSEKYKFKVDRIVPLGDAKEGDNMFKVYAVLDGTPTHACARAWPARPASTSRTSRMVWIWTHRLIDFVRLKLWM